MRLTAQAARTWRERSRAGIALIVLTAWFGSLLVAAPTTPRASASPGTPVITSGPSSSGNDSTPTWTFTLPSDSTSTQDVAADPLVMTDPADTATATTVITHRAKCAVSTTTPTAYADCVTPGAAPDEWTYTAPSFTAQDTYNFYVHDVETTTTTTTTYHQDGSTTDVVDGPTAAEGTDTVSAPYTYDATGPTLSWATEPASPDDRLQPQWSFTAGTDAVGTTCTMLPSVPDITDGAPCTSPVTATLTDNGSYDLAVTATDAQGNQTTIHSTYVLQDVTSPVVSIASPGNTTNVSWTITPPAGASELTAELTDPLGVTTSSTLPGTTTTYPFPTGRTEENDWKLSVTATVDGRVSLPGSATYHYDRTAPVLTVDPTPDVTVPNRPSWGVSVDDSTVSPQCRLTGTTATGASYDSLTSTCGATYTAPAALAEGTYTLAVTATDDAGNAAAPVTRSYTYDVTAPAQPLLGSGDNGNAGFAITSPITWTVKAADTDTTRITCVVTYDDGSSVVTVSTTPACGATVSASPTAAQQGVWTLTATAYDSVGNASTAATSSTTYDSVLNAPQLTGPTGAAKSPTWQIALDQDATAKCTVAGVTVSPVSCNTGFTMDLSAKPGALYTLVVKATDAAGNKSQTSVDYMLPPDPPVVSVATQGKSTNPAWTISAQSGATLSCTLISPTAVRTAVTPCASGMTPTLSGDGVWNLEVVATVSTANGPDASAPGSSPVGYRLDTTAPGNPTISATPVGPQNTASVDWTVTPANDSGDTVRVDCDVFFTDAVTGIKTKRSTVTGCDVSGVHLTFTAADQGDWQTKATAVDAVGNKSSVVAGPVVTYDITAPSAPVIVALRSPSNNPSPTWTINHDVATSLECAWTTGSQTPLPGDWFACYSFGVIDVPQPQDDGVYTLHARATDLAQNTGPEAKQDYELDRTKPLAPTFSTPTSPSSSASVTWTISSGSEVGPTLECRLLQDDGTGTFAVVAGYDWQACTTPTSFAVAALPTEGTYAVESRVTDYAGNLGPAATSSPYVFDKTPPAMPTIDGPTGPSQSRDVTWTITPSDPADTLECRFVENGSLVSTTFTACGTSVSRTNLPDGSYGLQVQERDAALNVSTPVAKSPTYVVDNVGPAAPTFAGSDGTGNATTTSWSFKGEGGATPSCTLYHGTVALTASPVACKSGDVFDLSDGDGPYQVEVLYTDVAGNAGVPKKSPVYLLDTIKPNPPDLHGPSNTANGKSISYTFTAEPSSIAACRLLFSPAGSNQPPAPIGSGAFTPCTSPWPVTLSQGDGAYRAEAHVTDLAGNQSDDSQSEIYTLDTTGPAAPVFTAQPTGTKNVKAVTWTWSGETPSTGVCSLSFTPTGSTVSSVVAGPVACDSGSYATTLTYGDGLYQLTVTLTDPYFNKGLPATSAGYTLDATPPAAPTVSGPSKTSNKTTADYRITSVVEAGATAECRLSRDGVVVQDWASCTLPETVTLGADGSYVLEVRLTDQYGNRGLPGASPAYLLDTKPPTIPVVKAPASPSSSASPTFSITTDSDTTVMCRLSRGAVVAVDTTACGGTYTPSLTGQPDGDYVLTVIATDPAGNTSTGVSGSYTYDTTKPTAPVVSGPAGPSQVHNPVFTWVGETGASAECSLQEKAGAPGPWTACSTPYAPALPADGTWVLSVRLSDAAHNVSDPGSSGPYVFDTTPPPAPVVTPPTSPGRDLSPSWSAVIEDGSHADCRLTGPGQLGGWAPCTLPTHTPLGDDGLYTFEVRTTDAAGNTSQAGSATYLLDTTPPAAPVVAQPSGPGRTRAPSISFTSELGTTATCRLTRGTTVLSDSAACTSPTTLDLTGLADGAYTLSVRAVDLAGNVGPAGSATYVLDTTAPATPTFTLVPGSPSSDHAPVFGFSVESGATASCKVTVPGGTVKDLSCGSPLTLDLSNAGDGDYVVAIRATDPAGNVSAAATATYQLDSNAPVAPRVVGPASPSNVRSPSWKVSSSSPAECRLSRGTTVVADWKACGSTYSADLYSQPDGTYLLEARVVGTTASTQSRYRLDTTPPAAATIIAPPSPSTNRKPTWAVSSPDTTVSAQCRVLVFTGVLKDWASCAVSPAGSLYSVDLTGLGDGTYSLVVRLTDAAGNVGPDATSDFVLDTSAPAAVGVVGPLPNPGNSTTPTWTLTSAPGVKLECRLSSGQKVISDFAPCAGTFTADLSGLPDATYTLTVRALSAAGTPGPETNSGYILDTTAAGAASLVGPASPSRNRAPSWTFTVPTGTHAVCKVTYGGKVFQEQDPCTSPYVLDLSNAPDGTYTFTVHAVDPAGNAGPTSTSSYTLKTTAPPAPVFTTVPGSPSSTTNPQWGFTLFRGTKGECRLVQGGTPLEDWHACTSPTQAFLSGKPDGVYTMQVRAVDLAGNTSSPAPGGSYTFDRSAEPLVSFLDTPSTPGFDRDPTWVISAPPATAPTDTTAGLRTAALSGTPHAECRYTMAGRGPSAWAPCSGPFVGTTAADGTYVLEARTYDDAGTRGPISTSSYQLDTVRPPAPRFDPAPVVGNDPEATWSWAEDESQVQCRLLRDGVPLDAFNNCDPPYIATIGRLGEATYTIEARAVDAAQNVGPIARASYRYDITPPAAPVFASHPGAAGTSSSVTWTFAVPTDSTAICVVRRDGSVVSTGPCAGSATVDLRGQSASTWALSVHFVDSAGNVGPSTVGTYRLTGAVSPGRVTSPGTDRGGDSPGTPRGGGSTPPDVTQTPSTATGADAIVNRVRGAIAGHVPPVIKKAGAKAKEIAEAVGTLPNIDVPRAIKKTIVGTITKPQLPLALFVIVLLFLLVQNRIDRRDPKLAAAPVSAEPELTFGPILRAGGATA